MVGLEGAQQTKIKQCHRRNNAVAWQEYQLVHKLKWKETEAELKEKNPIPKQYPAQRRNEIQRMKT